MLDFLDIEAHKLIGQLKVKVRSVVPTTNVSNYSISPALIADEGLTLTEQSERTAYLSKFADSFCDQVFLLRVVGGNISQYNRW